MFSIYQILLILIGASAIIVHYIYDKKNWVDVYAGAQSNIGEVQEIYKILRDSGVKCRLKTRNQPISRMQTSQIVSAVVQVKKDEEHKATKLINEKR
ncbi:hypothetical protein [Natranaerobius trueperi]|uniref:DUF2007 domain-containing protein n=1 Tax=Natranaerobius trueperi TaxID=759412 RepID=A0A226C0Z3_9FIRM|nr:hypothetical protein [Natranaerobius trueperi]OWZ84896.1 hypothetical protein CDO51_00370 [Natranaerobius trueperi]